MIERLLEGLRATSAWETLSVLLGIGYVVYAVRRQRLAWILGGASSAILVYLYARGQLPMQALLNAFYVAMSFYGYAQWTRQAIESEGVSTLPLRWHLLAGLIVLAAAYATARLLAAETNAAWPFLDAWTTWASLFATWLAARAKLENWIYWLVIDALTAVLSAAQGLVLVALLFVLYLGFSAVGFVAWWRQLRSVSPAVPVAT